jgi:hypothetical protein
VSDIEFVQGMFFNKPSDKAPDWVVGNISIKADEFVRWLEAQRPNDKGFIKIKVNESKAGKVYCALDDYEPQQQRDEEPKRWRW